MPTSRLTITGDIGGASMNSSVVKTASGAINQEVALAAAKTGTLSTRTDDDTGTLTMEAGHGIQTGDTIDLYWDGGRQYDVTVGTVSGTSVPIDLGTGDALPAQDTEITAQVQTVIDTDFEGDLVEMLGLRCDQRAHFSFFDGSTNEKAADLVANELWYWVNGGPHANPLASKTVTQAKATQASTTAATLKMGVLYDSGG